MCLIAMPLLATASPAMAGWKLKPAGQAAIVDNITITPAADWNQWTGRPGKQGRTWTRDGFELNSLEVFSGVPNGQPLYRERNRKQNPLPKFDKSMLLPDLATFFERSFRTYYNIADFTVNETVPDSISGHQGIRVTYRFVSATDELVLLGEARLAVVGGQLYAINFFAPELHYFDAGIGEVHDIMDGAQISAK
ncbi:MAG: hypothetical protein R3E09_00030 [Novosphingobium sp.]|nr:hypothetical protein [Novosphingobium sp.]